MGPAWPIIVVVDRALTAAEMLEFYRRGTMNADTFALELTGEELTLVAMILDLWNPGSRKSPHMVSGILDKIDEARSDPPMLEPWKSGQRRAPEPQTGDWEYPARWVREHPERYLAGGQTVQIKDQFSPEPECPNGPDCGPECEAPPEIEYCGAGS